MGTLSFLSKEFREHVVSLAFLLFAYVLVLLILTVQIQNVDFFMSNMQVVRLSLISLVPLCIYIFGNLLLVREYVGQTMQYLESLPIRISHILIVKFFIGLVFSWALILLALVIVEYSSQDSEMITNQYLFIVGLKSLSIATLYWCVVFCISLFGKVRFILYTLLALVLLLIVSSPHTDKSLIAPIALLEYKEFVFERDIIPWSQLMQCFGIALAFVLVAFLIVTVNDGSIIERLAKPMSRRDLGGLFLLIISGLTVYTGISEKWKQDEFAFDASNALISDFPRVEVNYIEPANREKAQEIMDSVRTALQKLQIDAGLQSLPKVRVVLDVERMPFDIALSQPDGVLVRTNYIDFGVYGKFALKSFIFHGVLSSLTNSRMVYEPTHWMLDGFSLWWALESHETTPSDHMPALEAEVLARAVYVHERSEPGVHLLLDWELMADRHGDESTSALAYSALKYLAEINNKETVSQLATHYLNADYSDSSIETLRRLLTSRDSVFESHVGISLEQFVSQWQQWLLSLKSDTKIAEFLSAIPNISGEVRVVQDDSLNSYLHGQYSALADYSAEVDANCVLRYEWIAAFDYELNIEQNDAYRSDCSVSGLAHEVAINFAQGERLYATLAMEVERFHEPVTVWAGRLIVP